MGTGAGTDILLIQRMRDTLESGGIAFLNKAFTPKEREEAALRMDPPVYLATRFAGKEAVFKSMGLDADRVRFNEIEILNGESGAPFARLLGSTRDLARETGITDIAISLSHEGEYALAFAICTNDNNSHLK